MAQNTDINDIPWPELGDEPNIENAVKPLAEWIDDRLIPRFATTTERDGKITAPVDGMVCYVATHGLMMYSTSWFIIGENTLQTTTTGISAATGFSVVAARLQRLNGMTSIHVQCERTGAALTATAVGNLTDTTMATIPAPYRPVSRIFDTFSATVTSGGAYIDTDGTLVLADAHPGSSISTGNNIYIVATYPSS